MRTYFGWVILVDMKGMTDRRTNRACQLVDRPLGRYWDEAMFRLSSLARQRRFIMSYCQYPDEGDNDHALMEFRNHPNEPYAC